MKQPMIFQINQCKIIIGKDKQMIDSAKKPQIYITEFNVQHTLFLFSGKESNI